MRIVVISVLQERYNSYFMTVALFTIVFGRRREWKQSSSLEFAAQRQE